MTAVQWETLFAKLSSQIDDIPIAKTNSSNVRDSFWDLITPNRLKLGRNNFRNLQGPISITRGSGLIGLLNKNQQIQAFWYQLLLDHIHHLIPRPSKWTKTDIINIGDICLFTYKDSSIKTEWKIGKVLSKPSQFKIVIEYPSNKTYGKDKLFRLTQIVRSPRDISIISAVEDIDLNSKKYYEKIAADSN